jgi:hypothetical protein
LRAMPLHNIVDYAAAGRGLGRRWSHISKDKTITVITAALLAACVFGGLAAAWALG